MEKRVLIAILLCFVSLYLWQALVVKPVPKPATPATLPENPATSSGRGNTIVSPPAEAPPSAAAPAVPLPAALTSEASERTIHVETKDVIAEFTNRGARLKSWRLKRYLDQNREPQELIVDLPSQPLPFTLQTTDESAAAAMTQGLFAVRGAEPGSGVQSSPVDLSFEYRDSAGLHVVKDVHLDPTGYVVSVRAKAVRGAEGADGKAIPFAIAWGPAVGDVSESSRYVQKPGGLLYQTGSVVRKTPKDFATQPVYEGDFKYAGVDDNYFMTVALSPGPGKVIFQPVTIPPPPGSKDAARELVGYAIDSKASDAPLKFFAGPKDFDVLKATGGDELTAAINFGMFRLIVVPLLSSLKGINRYIGNYGWSIIILTVIINAIMFPLRHKSNVSMRKMQQLQPEVKAIQDRYAKLKATDPAKQKMNTELMTLYRERGVNPAGGCVPMLLTMPVLIALYALLSTAIELRGAPFFGWIHDLSLHDPLYITPVVMGATMFWQQRLAPAGADPAQQKMMMFMPIVFTGMFLWAPAGVAIYWLIGNLLGIGQQYLTNYLIGPPAVRTVRPAAERRVKRPGGPGGKAEMSNSKP